MVTLGLIGVGMGEGSHRLVEAGALAEVRVQSHRVAGARVGPRQDRAALLREVHEVRGDPLGVRDDLHVAELPTVEVRALNGRPPDEDVGGALDEQLPRDHPFPVIAVRARAEVRFVDRRTGLLDLEEERIVPVAAVEQDEVHAHPDAADADDLPYPIDEGEAIEQLAAVLAEAHPVRLEDLLHEIGAIGVFGADPDGRILDDAWSTIDRLGELRERAVTRPSSGALLDVGGDPLPIFELEHRQEVVDGDEVVPDVELLGGRVPAPCVRGSSARRAQRLPRRSWRRDRSRVRGPRDWRRSA